MGKTMICSMRRGMSAVCLVAAMVAFAPALRAADKPADPAKVAAAPAETPKAAPAADGAKKGETVSPVRAAFDAPRRGEIAMDNVNIRSGPGIGEKVVGILRNHEQVSAVAQVGDWVEIQYPAKIPAWVSKDYVDAPKDAQAKADGTRVGKVNSPRVRIRATGEMNAKVLHVAVRGEEVTIVGETGLWYKLAAPSTATCFVHKSCVELEAAKPVAAAPEVATKPQAPATVPASADAETKTAPAEVKSVPTPPIHADPLIPISAAQPTPAEQKAADSPKAEAATVTAARLPADGSFIGEGILQKPLAAPAGDLKYRLTKGGITTYYVKAAGDGVDLDAAVGKLVGVKGRMLAAPKGLAHQVIVVDGMTIAE